MNKLTKKDKYAIQFLYQQGWNDIDIAKELDLSDKSVKSFIKKYLSETQKTNTSESVAHTKEDKTKNLMIRQTAAKKSNTVSIMTHGASQIGDEFYKNAKSNPKNTDSYIFRRS